MSWHLLGFIVEATDEYNKFKRRVIKPKDCVINALQILGVVNDRIGDIMRIMVGDRGVSGIHIEEIFNYLRPDYEHKFLQMKDTDMTIQQLSLISWSDRPSVVLGGFLHATGGHVVIIERSSMGGHFKIIDPQKQSIEFCGDEPEDFVKNCLAGTTAFFLLYERKR